MTESGLPSWPLWAYGLLAALTVAILALSAKGQRLRPGRLWIVPSTLILLTAFALGLEPARPLPLLALDGSALAAGAALGWWRGQFTRITIDPESLEMRSFTSPLGMVALLAVVAGRLAFRVWLISHADLLHLSVDQATEAVLLLALGFVAAERVELGLRAAGLVRTTRLNALLERVSPTPSSGRWR